MKMIHEEHPKVEYISLHVHMGWGTDLAFERSMLHTDTATVPWRFWRLGAKAEAAYFMSQTMVFGTGYIVGGIDRRSYGGYDASGRYSMITSHLGAVVSHEYVRRSQAHRRRCRVANAGTRKDSEEDFIWRQSEL